MGKRRKIVVDASSQDVSSSPFVCYFPSGKPDVSQLKFNVYQNVQPNKSSHVMIAGSSDCIDFVGRIPGAEYPSTQFCSYALGVYDKEQSTLRLLPVHGGRVVRVEPRAASLDYGPSGPLEQQDMSREARMARLKGLVASFGSTRRVRQLRQREEGAVGTDKLLDAPAAAEIIAQAAQAGAEEGLTRDEVLAQSLNSRSLPPHHPEARTAAEAYVLRELVPTKAWGVLGTKRLLTAAQKPEMMTVFKEKQLVSEYVLHRAELLSQSKPVTDSDSGPAPALAFLADLLALYAARDILNVDTSSGKLEARSVKIRPEMLEALLELFYHHRLEGDRQVYERPASRKELLLLYIAAVALIAEAGSLAPPLFEELRMELKMSSADLATRFRELGATCSPAPLQGGGGVLGSPTNPKVRSFHVALLPQRPGEPVKTLAESLPKIKLGPKKR